MCAKKAMACDVYATIYESQFDLGYTCSHATKCKFALCEIMPPEDGAQCAHNSHNTCLSISAKIDATESLINKLKRELKKMEEELDNA